MSDTSGSGMPATLLATLVSILDVVVLERLSGGAFRQVGNQPAPEWFADAFHDVAPGEPVTLLQAFPVLDSLLSEAEIFWERTGHGRMEGEAVVVSGPGGESLPLATIAVAMDARCFLLIQRVAGFDDRQRILQRAREQALAQEEVVKRIDALHRPFGKLTALVTQLGDAPDLTGSQQPLVEQISGEIAVLRDLLKELPRLSPGTSARRR